MAVMEYFDGTTLPETTWTVAGNGTQGAPPTHQTPADYIVLICTPIIVISGTLGNVLSIVIMLRAHFRSISTGVYLCCLAIVDTVFLFVNNMHMSFINTVFGIDLTSLSEHTCRMYIYLLFVSKCLSAWFVVAVTVERLVAVSFPLKANVLTTRRRAWYVVGAMAIIACCVYSLSAITFGRQQLRDRPHCNMQQKYKDQNLKVALNGIDLVLACILPSSVLFFSNVALIVKLIQRRGLRNKLTRNQSERSRSGNSRLTGMLLGISVMFLLLNLPFSLYSVCTAVKPTLESPTQHTLIYRILYTLQITNNAINFPLYCLTGPTFRGEVANLCLCPCCRRVQCPLKRRLAKPLGLQSKVCPLGTL